MPEQLDSSARIAKLRALGLADKFPDLVALDDAERAADAEIASIESKLEAEHEARRRANTPIAFTLATTPEAADDLAIVQVDRSPMLSSVIVDGQRYEPQLARGPICFLPARFAAALNTRVNPTGWSWCSLTQTIALDEWFTAQAFRSIVASSTSEQIPVLVAIYRRLATRSSPQARSHASLLANALSRLSHPVSGSVFVLPSARAEHQAEERDADRILSLAGTAGNASADIDRDTEQRRLTGEQINASNDKFSARADRDAARSAFNERLENAKFEAAIQAEIAEHQAAAATGAQ